MMPLGSGSRHEDDMFVASKCVCGRCVDAYVNGAYSVHFGRSDDSEIVDGDAAVNKFLVMYIRLSFMHLTQDLFHLNI